MKIRLLKPEDIKSAYKIIKENYPSKGWIKNAPKELRAMFSDCAVKPKYFVAEQNNQIIGCAGYTQSWMDYDVYEIFWVNIKPNFQKMGIGSLLIKRLIKEIKSNKGARLILLTTTIDEFYKKLGFKSLDIFDVDGFQLKYLDLQDRF